MRILIIDDDQSHGESLVDLLAARGHEPYYAASFGEAEWLSTLFRFDLSVIDFDMAQLTGPEAARRLKERSPDLDVVIVSAHGVSGSHRALIGDLPFFPKPIEADPFLELVESIFSRRRGSPLMVREIFPLQKKPRDSA